MKYPNQIEYLVYGRYALFSEPVNRIGGEKLTYSIPTYQSLKGVTEGIYWKPSITWIIDAVRVMKPIRTEAKSIRPISYNVAKSIRPISYNVAKNTLSIYTYLADVAYQVRAHFVFNERRMLELGEEPNEHKHYFIAKRMVEKGGRRDIFLGTRECQAYVEPCVFGEEKGYYDNCGEMKFDMMFHGFDYPDDTGRDMLAARFWHPTMTDGAIHFPTPTEIPELMRRDIRPMKAKAFGGELGNFMGLEEESIREELAKAGEFSDVVDAETVPSV